MTEAAYFTSSSRIRSSPLFGDPRPSVLLVVSHSLLPPADTTVRRRPYSPDRKACGAAEASVPFRGMRHRR